VLQYFHDDASATIMLCQWWIYYVRILGIIPTRVHVCIYAKMKTRVRLSVASPTLGELDDV
jgi:hypothetical protein